MDSIDLNEKPKHDPAPAYAAPARSKFPVGNDALRDLDNIVLDDVPVHVPLKRNRINLNEKSSDPWLADGDNPKATKKRVRGCGLLVALIALSVVLAICTVVLSSMVGLGMCAADSRKPVKDSSHAVAAMHTTTVFVTETLSASCSPMGEPTKAAQLFARTALVTETLTINSCPAGEPTKTAQPLARSNGSL